MMTFYCCLVLGAVVDAPYLAWTADVPSLQNLPPTLGNRLTPAELGTVRDGQPPLPYRDTTVGLRLPDGTLWIGMERGLARRGPKEPRWQLFQSRRWLPDDHVQDLSSTADGAVLVKTAAGIGRLRQVETTLEKKMAALQSELRRRHVREGLIGKIVLAQAGKPDAGHTQPSDDNDGLWTSLYVAAEAFRYGATRDPEAKRNAWESLQAMMFLEKVTGIPGFAARSFLPGSLPKPTDGEWHRSRDDRLWWKGDTSSDEIVGHYFAYAVYYDVAATPEEKEQIRPVIARITDHILDHGYYYIGPAGKPTTWGVWAPEKLNRDLTWVGDRGLNSLELLSHLKVAEHIVGAPRYRAAARELIDRHGYALNTVWQKHIWPPFPNHSDDELAFLSYYPLLWYERDPELRKIYLLSLDIAWKIEQPEISPLFNYIQASGHQASQWTDPAKRPTSALVETKSYDGQRCISWFRDVPADLITWTVKNSDRRDIVRAEPNRFRQASSKEVLPIAERPLMRWNGDPYQLDGGNGGATRDDGSFILLPYWMGRYHRFLDQ